MRTAVGVSALLGATAVVFFGMRHYATPPPKTMTKEYQEQTNEKAREENLNPITGECERGERRGREVPFPFEMPILNSILPVSPSLYHYPHRYLLGWLQGQGIRPVQVDVSSVNSGGGAARGAVPGAENSTSSKDGWMDGQMADFPLHSSPSLPLCTVLSTYPPTYRNLFNTLSPTPLSFPPPVPVLVHQQIQR